MMTIMTLPISIIFRRNAPRSEIRLNMRSVFASCTILRIVALEIGTSGDQSRHNGIGNVIFGGQHDYIAERRAPFTARPQLATCDPCYDVGDSQALAFIW